MKLFISYSHKDKDFAVRLYNTLVYSNIDVFINEKDIKTGDNIIEKIEEEIKEPAGLLYVISKHSVNSTWVAEELSMARVDSITQERNYTIYPLLIDDVEFPVSISKLKYADFKEWADDEKYYAIVSQLLSSLGAKPKKIVQRQIEFVGKNFTLLINTLQSLKILIGLAEGALDFYYYIRPNAGHINQSANDVTYRIGLMSRKMTNISFLLDNFKKSLLEEEFEYRDSLLQIISECSKNLTYLEVREETVNLAQQAIHSFSQLSETLNVLLNDFNREINVLIGRN